MKHCKTLVLLILLFSTRAHSQTVEAIQKGVQQMANNICADLHKSGPAAWIKYFSPSPTFFMVTDGQRVFASYDSAVFFVQHVIAKDITKIELKWEKTHVDPIATTVAIMSSEFEEKLTNKSNQQINITGYFTGTVEKTANGWKFRNLHWSTKR